MHRYEELSDIINVQFKTWQEEDKHMIRTVIIRFHTFSIAVQAVINKS